MHWKQHSQLVKRSHSPILFSLGVSSLGILCVVWAPQFKKRVKILECIQSKATKLVKCWNTCISWEEKLWRISLLELDKRRLRCDLTTLYRERKGIGEGGAHLFSLVPNNRMHGNAASGRFGLDSRKDIAEKVVRHWDRLSGKMTDASHFSVLMKNLSMSHNYATCKKKS